MAGLGSRPRQCDRRDPALIVAVPQSLAGRVLPEQVTVADFGIPEVHSAYELLDGAYDAVSLTPPRLLGIQVYPEGMALQPQALHRQCGAVALRAGGSGVPSHSR